MFHVDTSHYYCLRLFKYSFSVLTRLYFFDFATVPDGSDIILSLLITKAGN